MQSWVNELGRDGMGGRCEGRKRAIRGGRCLGEQEWVRQVETGRRRTVIYTEADVDGGGEGVEGQDTVKEDGDVEEGVVLLLGGFGGLHIDVGDEGLHLDPGLGAERGGGRGKGVGKDDDDEHV